MKRILYIALLLLSFLQVEGKGQTYPVSAFVNLTPPYSSYLPDYADPFNNQLRVLLTLNDFSIPSYTVKLRFRLEGSGYTIVNDNLLALPAFTLTPGVPIEISGNDLAPYLSSSNLSFTGIDVADYELRKVLPEGPCSICVEVVDFSNPNQAILGNPACVQAWFSLNDPPLLNMPFCGQEIPETDPQNIVFSWTPMSMGSPYSVSTEYTFELFELRPEGADPNMTVTSTLPIYTTTTTNTLLNYGIIEPPLQLGMQYVWRVRAREIDGRDIYRNNGYSAVCTFTYGNIAASLADGITLELNAEGIGPRIGKAFWNTAAVFDGYRLEVRKTGNPDYAWFPYESATGMITVNSLEPETEYEARVQGLIGEDFESEWSNIATFTTYPPPNYACGSTALPGKQETIIPLTNLMVGNFVSFGQFDMQLTQVDPLGTPGHYKGYGKILVPFALTNFPVRFDDILVDENFMVREGRADALTDGLAEYINWLDREFINGIIDDIAVDTIAGTVTVTFGDETKTFTFPENGGPLVLEDESGLIFIINPDGTITYDGNINIDNDVLAATENYQIYFLGSEDHVFGFDRFDQPKWRNHYKTIILEDGYLYTIPFKSLGENETDQCLAVFRTSGDPSSASFETSTGTSIPFEVVNDSTYLLTLSGLSEDAVIYGFNGEDKIGKLKVKVYEEKLQKITLIPLAGTSIGDLETAINAIYIQANLRVEIQINPIYEGLEWDLNADGLMEAPQNLGLMTKYSTEMRVLRDTYLTDSIDRESVYLFVVPGFSAPDLDGYMVRGKGLGFIVSESSGHTLAHEVCHGAFSLKHTFDEIPQGTTTNLMDYAGISATRLTASQWDDMHNPPAAFSFLDDEEDGGFSYGYSSFVITTELSNIEVDALNNENIYFQTASKNIITWDPNYNSAIEMLAVEDGYFLGVSFNELDNHPSGYYKPQKLIKDSELELNDGELIADKVFQGTRLIYTNIPDHECPLDSNYDPKNDDRTTCVKFKVNYNGTKGFARKNIPNKYIINTQKLECQPGIDIVREIVFGELFTTESTEKDCESLEGDFTNGSIQISPMDVVYLSEVYNDDYDFFGPNDAVYLNHLNQPVKASEFENIQFGLNLHSFKRHDTTYSAVLIKKNGKEVIYTYVNRSKFLELQIINNDTVKVIDLLNNADIIFDDFDPAFIGDKLYYSLTYSYEECTGLKVYSILHDGRENYKASNNPYVNLGTVNRYFENAEGQIILHRSCNFAILCDAITTAGEGLVNIFSDLASRIKIDEKYWNPNHLEYDNTLYLADKLIAAPIDNIASEDARLQMFAFKIGLINGIVIELAAIGEGSGFIAQLLCSAEQMEALWDAMWNFDEIFVKIMNNYVTEFSEMDLYQRYEFSGRMTIAIASVVIPLTKIKYAKIISRAFNVVKNASLKLFKLGIKIKNGIYRGLQLVGDVSKIIVYYSEKFAQILESGVIMIEREFFVPGPHDYLVLETVDNAWYTFPDLNFNRKGKIDLIEKNDGSYGISITRTIDDLLESIRPRSKLNDDDWLKFVVDFGENETLLKRFDDEIELAEAWKTLINHPVIRKDVASLEAVSKIINNPNLASVITEADLATIVQKLANKGVKCRTCVSGNSSYKYMDEILGDIEHGLIKFGGDYDAVLRGFKQGGNFTEGAMYVAHCLKKYPDLFPTGTVFEFTEVTVNGVRRVDVRVYNTFYEFKSVATGGSPPAGFVDQFIKDLQLPDVNDISQIKWWFDETKVSSLNKTEFLDALNQATIDQGTINKLVKNGPKTKQALINLIDSNFNSIFTLK